MPQQGTRMPDTYREGLIEEGAEQAPKHPGSARFPRGGFGGLPEGRPWEWSPLPRFQGSMPEAETNAVVLKRDALYRRGLALSDVASAAFAVAVAASVGGHDKLKPWMLLSLPLIVLASKVVGLYDRDEHLMRKTTLDEAPALFQVATLFTLLIWLADGIALEGGWERPQIAGLWALLFLSMLVARGATRRMVKRVVPVERCLLLGDTVSAARVRRLLSASPMLKGELVAELPLAVGRRKGEHSLEAAGRAGSLTEMIEDHDIHRVIIAPTTSGAEETLDAIRLAKALGVRVSVLPRLMEVVGSSAKWDDVDGLTLLGVPNYGLSKSSALVKRTADLVVAGGALAILSPLLALIAVAVKLSSRGPVLFRQQRIGKDGTEFEMLKFRSMVSDADQLKHELRELNEAEGLFKIADDPRCTPIGRAIRRLSLDELPQLLNVLRGDMSLVGPRPLVPEEDSRAQGWERRRLLVMPGMTGVWQILGPTRIPFNEMVKLDYLYGANWSIWLDLKVLIRTVLFMLSRRGL